MDDQTRLKIEKENTKILNEIDLKEPPLLVEDVLQHLELFRGYYNLEDPNLLKNFWHEVEIKKHQFFKLVREKAKLVAMWFPKESQILIDDGLPKPKQKWATHHEIEHRIIPWHRSFYLGDTVQTLDPHYQEILEAEANFGTSYLMFCGGLFKKEAIDTIPEWASIAMLQKRHHNSIESTLRRYTIASHSIPIACFISTAPWQEKPDKQPNRWRYFDKSDEFTSRFGSVNPAIILPQIDDNIVRRRGGPVGDYSLFLKDVNNTKHEFRAESFFNGYNILTLIVYQKQLEPCQIIIP